MPEARDRLSRAEDVAAVYSRRRMSIIADGNAGGASFRVSLDDPVQVSTTPFRWGATPMTGTPRVMEVATISTGGSSGGGFGRGSFVTPRIRRGRSLRRSPGSVIGRENTSPAVGSNRGRGRGRGRVQARSVLPSWYPRTPFQDITTIVRAIERRRASLRDGEGLQLESPMRRGLNAHVPTLTTSAAQLEHDISMVSPFPSIRSGHCPVSVGKLPKILLDITNKNVGESAFLTPQKKLLNSIDTVEKAVMEELHKLKRTATAKKAEREKKVRTLMSMR